MTRGKLHQRYPTRHCVTSPLSKNSTHPSLATRQLFHDTQTVTRNHESIPPTSQPNASTKSPLPFPNLPTHRATTTTAHHTPKPTPASHHATINPPNATTAPVVEKTPLGARPSQNPPPRRLPAAEKDQARTHPAARPTLLRPRQPQGPHRQAQAAHPVARAHRDRERAVADSEREPGGGVQVAG